MLSKGTHVNATHFQVTAKCTGCSTWGDSDIGISNLTTSGPNPLAFAFSTVPVDNPASNTTNFSIHDLIGHWVHDFAQGVNPNFSSQVSKNL